MKTDRPENNALKGFDRGYKWLHWGMAVLILLMLFALIGFSEGMTTQKRMEMLVGHSSIGSIISLLIIIRLFKRFFKKDVQPSQDIARWQIRVSKIVQMGLYICMILVPLSGYLTARVHELPVMMFGTFDLSSGIKMAYDPETFISFRMIHEEGINALLVLLVLHIGAAFYHKFVKKDQVLASMTRIRSH